MALVHGAEVADGFNIVPSQWVGLVGGVSELPLAISLIKKKTVKSPTSCDYLDFATVLRIFTNTFISFSIFFTHIHTLLPCCVSGEQIVVLALAVCLFEVTDCCSVCVDRRKLRCSGFGSSCVALLWVCVMAGEIIHREHENWNWPSLGPFPNHTLT